MHAFTCSCTLAPTTLTTFQLTCQATMFTTALVKTDRILTAHYLYYGILCRLCELNHKQHNFTVSFDYNQEGNQVIKQNRATA